MAKKDYVRYINSLLNENTEQSKQELSDLFADEEFRKNDMLEDTRMGYMYIAICIYREEKAAHIEENILMNVDSLGEICDLICDIKCYNDDKYISECLHYINRLTVPDGYLLDVLTVKNADSMTSGYNAAMNETDAKYKIYMHQDVFIVNINLLEDILKIFEDKNVGMLGVVGTPNMPENGCMWNGPRVGRVYSSNVLTAKEFIASDMNERPYMEVEAVDGLFIATQYDIIWREDLFTGWDFYDVSQGEEFRRNGYKVVVPYMDKPWCIHDDGFLNLSRYDEFRDIFLKEYK